MKKFVPMKNSSANHYAGPRMLSAHFNKLRIKRLAPRG
jgi:hypothetical protein